MSVSIVSKVKAVETGITLSLVDIEKTLIEKINSCHLVF
jgi:hypothetical protein